MKLIFVTQEDPFYIRIFFETFFKNYKVLDEVQGVFICNTMGKSKKKLAKQMFEFYGLWDFLRMGLLYSGLKIMGTLFKKVNLGRFFNLEHVCHYYNIKIIK